MANQCINAILGDQPCQSSVKSHCFEDINCMVDFSMMLTVKFDLMG